MNKDTKNFIGTIGAIALVLGTATMLQGHIALADEVHESLFDKQSDTVTSMIKAVRTKRLAKYRVVPSTNQVTSVSKVSTPKKTATTKDITVSSSSTAKAAADAQAKAAAEQAYQQQQYDQYLAQLRAQRTTRVSSAS